MSDNILREPSSKPIRLYLAGPMSGHADLNFPLFNAEAARLRALGYDVVNPAEINSGADLVVWGEMTPEERQVHWNRCMCADIPLLCTCDGIALLPNWEKSRGATIERGLALELGESIHYAADLVHPLPARAGATDWAAA